MMNRLIAGAVVSLLVTACATTAQAPPTASTKRPPVGCVSDTATRLPVPANGCAGVGSTYTKEDMDRTGQVYAQDALRLLDPTVIVRP